MLTADRLREELSYDAETGLFTRLKTEFGKRAGQLAGTRTSHGYVQIKVAGYLTYAHRLAWLYVYGTLPSGEVDHINGDRSDNRLCNLRDVTTQTNAENRRSPGRNNKSGFLGVSWDAQRGKWKAGIVINGRWKHIGFDEDPAVAHEMYVSAKRQHHAGGTL